MVVGMCNEPGVVFSLFAQTSLMIMLHGGTTGFPSSQISKPQLLHHTLLGEAGPCAKVAPPTHWVPLSPQHHLHSQW